MTFDNSPHGQLPIAFESLLRGLRDFQTDVIGWTEMEKGATRDAEADRLHDWYFEIVANAPRTAADSIDKTEADYAFIEGVLRAMQLRETIVDEQGIVDTFGSQTVGFFDTDYRGDDGDDARVVNALASITGLDADYLERFDEEFEKAELGTLRDRMAVIDAIGELYDLTDADTIERLFGAMYPEFAVQDVVEITAIRTATSLFFCVPFETVSHLSEKEAKADNLPLANLWGHVVDLRQRDMAHFPVFGFFEGYDVADEVLDAIADRAGLAPMYVADLLTTMISILPAEEVDKYIVHDAWGHQWQSLLFAFEDTYQDTAAYSEPPPMFTEHNDVTLGELLTQGSEDEFDDFLSRELEQRLIHSVSGLFAEVLADAMEYKFLHIRKDLRDKMPSSSFLKMLPAKLDLTLHDLPIYIRFACRGLLFDNDEEKDALGEAYMIELSEPPPWAEIDTLAKSAKARVEREHDFDFRTDQDQVELNATAQLALQFFELVTAYNDVMLDPALTETSSPVFKRHFDLLVFTTASYFERNRLKHFWEIDTFIREEFVPRYLAFQKALT